MSDLQEVGGVLVPTLGQGASVTFEDQLEPNLSPEIRKFQRARERMIEKNRKEWERDQNRISE